jgi:hypothetical protein
VILDNCTILSASDFCIDGGVNYWSYGSKTNTNPNPGLIPQVDTLVAENVI